MNPPEQQMRALSLSLLVFCLIYGVIEFRRWRSPELRDLLSRPQRIRRIVNYAALCVVIAMALGGTWFPTTHPTKQVAVLELAYWSVLLAVAAVIPIIAVWEYRATMRQSQIAALAADRDEAFQKVVEAVAKTEEQTRRRAELPHRNGHD
jgi:hypothetical protein